MNTAPEQSSRGSIVIVALIIVLIAFGLIGGFLFYFKNLHITTKNQTASTSIENTTSNTMVATIAPMTTDTTLLYPNINWTSQPQAKSTRAVIHVVHDQTNKTNDVNLPGKTWMYEKKGIKTLEEFNKDTTWSNMLSYYQEKLSDWTQSIKSGNSTIEAISADGGGASMMGYMKQTGDTIQMISLYAQTTFAKGEFPINAECPCDTRYEVFTSDILPLQKIIADK